MLNVISSTACTLFCRVLYITACRYVGYNVLLQCHTSVIIASATISTLTTSTRSGAVTPTPGGTGQSGGSSGGGGSVGGIIAGVIVGILVCVVIVCVIVFLLWYRAKKKEQYKTNQGIVLYTLSTRNIECACKFTQCCLDGRNTLMYT